MQANAAIASKRMLHAQQHLLKGCASTKLDVLNVYIVLEHLSLAW